MVGDGRSESPGCLRLLCALESCVGLTHTLTAPARPSWEFKLETLIHNILFAINTEHLHSSVISMCNDTDDVY